MNKSKLLFTIILSMFLCLGIKDVYAFSSSNYQNRSLCGTYEVAGFHTDGVIDKVACYSDYASAKNFMKSNGASDLAIMTKVNGKTKIIDANAALVDLTVSPSDLTYYYRSPGGASYTYMNNKGSYGGVDGVLLETSNYNGNWWIKLEINDCKAWISQNDYELVPTTWVKQPSTYNITSDSIRHNYSSKLQSGSIIGGSEYETPASSGRISVIPEAELILSDEWRETPSFGLYKVTWTVTVGDQTESIEKIIFLISPLAIIISMIFLTFITIWIIIVVRRRKERHSRLAI